MIPSRLRPGIHSHLINAFRSGILGVQEKTVRPRCMGIYQSRRGRLSIRAVHSSGQVTGTNETLASTTAELSDFGSLAEKHDLKVFELPADRRIPDDGNDVKQTLRHHRSNNTPYWYFLQCKRLAKQGKVVECVQFLEKRMLQEDQVPPQESNFTVVIGALGRVGYVKKAFQLYNQMKGRGLTPTLATYTALFNAVASSQHKSEIKRAIKLYEEIHRKRVRLGRITYNSAIKAFGRHGTMEQMMGLFRESMISGFEPDCDTFNMLLLSVEKDQNTGFRYAIEIWRQMEMLDVKPNGKSITYLLKILKNCGIGDLEIANRKLLTDVPHPDDYKNFFSKHIRNVYWLKGQTANPRKILIEENNEGKQEILTVGLSDILVEVDETSIGTENKIFKGRNFISPHLCKEKEDILIESETMHGGHLTKELTEVTPNLLTMPFQQQQHGSKVVEIKDADSPGKRLQLIGGYEYIFILIKKYEIEPTVMLLSILMQALEANTKAENDIMEFAEKSNTPLDVDFFNVVIHRRAKRMQHREIREVLNRIVKHDLTPNYRTWCTVALSCINVKHGVQLINEVVKTKVSLDTVFFNSLICAALRNKTATKVQGYEGVYGYDYRYLCRIIRGMEANNLAVNHRTISLLEKASDWPEGYKRWENADLEFERKVFYFRGVYKRWLDNVEIVTEKRPFEEFKDASTT